MAEHKHKPVLFPVEKPQPAVGWLKKAHDAALARGVGAKIKPDSTRKKARRTESGCGANAPGGGGFQPGNTCARGGKEERPAKEEAPRGGISEVEAEGLFYRVGKSGGFTYQPIDDTTPTTGYALSTNPEYETVFDAETLSEDDIYNYLVSHREVFDDPAKFAGGWHDTEAGKIYLDISHVTQDREEAITLAREHNQEGIFDLGSFETIIVKNAEDRRL